MRETDTEMFPRLAGSFRFPGRMECQAEADSFVSGWDSTESWMSSESAFFWSTIRDLMLAGF